MNRIALVTIRLKEGVSDEVFLKAIDDVQTEHFDHAEGLLSHKILKGDDGLWSDITEWKTEEDSLVSRKEFGTRPSVHRLHALIEREAMQIAQATVLRSF